MTEATSEAVPADASVPDSRDDGDIAADYLEELLDISDVDGDLDIEVRESRTYISVNSDGESNLSKLADGETVDALQHLTRLAVQAETGEFSRLILDIGGSRDARRTELAGLVERAITRIEEGASSAALPPCRPTSARLCTTSFRSVGTSPSPRARRGSVTRSFVRHRLSNSQTYPQAFPQGYIRGIVP